MGYLKLGFLLLATCCIQGVTPIPQECTFEWDKIDWNQPLLEFSTFLQYPGVLVSGKKNITFSELLEFTGLLWNAKSPQHISGLICKNYVPLIHALYPDEKYRDACDQVVTSLNNSVKIDVYKDCKSQFETLELLISNEVNNTLRYSDTCSPQDDDYLCVVERIAISNTLDLIELASRIAFNLLDWLGPSPFSFDVYGGCSTLRQLMYTQIDDIVEEFKSIVTYVVTDGLKYFNDYNGCDLLDESVMQSIDRVLFANQQNGTCDFFANNPSREDYKSKAEEIIDNMLSFPVDKDQCLNVVNLVAESDNVVLSYVSMVTGFNISINNDRQRFCTRLTESLSSQYTPSTYVFPESEDWDTWIPFEEDGELLPNFYFTDAAGVWGAFFRSETVQDGANLLCSLFKSSLTDVSQYDSINEICSAFKMGDNAAVERKCRELTVPRTFRYYYYYPSPLSLRVPNVQYEIAIGMAAMKKLFQLETISVESVCQALDNFFYSNNNLQSVVRVTLDAQIAELLPIANDICDDYDNIINYPTNSDSYVYNVKPSSTEYADLILTHFGFANRNDLCSKIADGINEESGRATDDSTSFFVDESLRFLTSEKRCGEIIERIKLLVNTQGNIDPITVVTGYTNTATLCGAVISSFTDKCSDATVLRLCSPFLMLTMLLMSMVFGNR